jgi:hypothetical protein
MPKKLSKNEETDETLTSQQKMIKTLEDFRKGDRDVSIKQHEKTIKALTKSKRIAERKPGDKEREKEQKELKKKLEQEQKERDEKADITKDPLYSELQTKDDTYVVGGRHGFIKDWTEDKQADVERLTKFYETNKKPGRPGAWIGGEQKKQVPPIFIMGKNGKMRVMKPGEIVPREIQNLDISKELQKRYNERRGRITTLPEDNPLDILQEDIKRTSTIDKNEWNQNKNKDKQLQFREIEILEKLDRISKAVDKSVILNQMEELEKIKTTIRDPKNKTNQELHRIENQLNRIDQRLSLIPLRPATKIEKDKLTKLQELEDKNKRDQERAVILRKYQEEEEKAYRKPDFDVEQLKTEGGVQDYKALHLASLRPQRRAEVRPQGLNLAVKPTKLRTVKEEVSRIAQKKQKIRNTSFKGKGVPETNTIRDYVIFNFEDIASPEEIEGALFEAYKEDPEKYLSKVSDIREFITFNSVLGQFSKFFREKAKQGVYPATRYVSIEIDEMFPEVFLTQNEDVKKDIITYLQSQRDSFLVEIDNLLHTGRSQRGRPTFYSAFIRLEDFKDKKLSNICYNKWWENKLSTTVIIKDTGYFYCLDIFSLKDGKNPFTGKKLDKACVQSIKKAVKELDQKKFVRNTDEKNELTATKKKLEELAVTLKKYLNNPIAIIQKYGDIIPPIVQEEILDKPEEIENIVNNMIKEITTILETQEFRTDTKKEIKEMEFNAVNAGLDYEIPDVPEGFEIDDGSDNEGDDGDGDGDRAEMPGSGMSVENDDSTVSNTVSNILQPNTVSRYVYDEYINQLHAMKELLEEDLEKMPERGDEVSELLHAVDKEIENIEESCSTVEGIKKLVEKKRDSLKKHGVELELVSVMDQELEYLEGME